mmetsp:Transcript_77690/g.186393  ORF Transcript_77690/g.186393 Transcript_77690/m.186393 type:complete len:102 (+) Transcript_77690:2864-3169(+)
MSSVQTSQTQDKSTESQVIKVHTLQEMSCIRGIAQQQDGVRAACKRSSCRGLQRIRYPCRGPGCQNSGVHDQSSLPGREGRGHKAPGLLVATLIVCDRPLL